MYRPTVKYDYSYKKYVEDLFHATNLNRSQIIRLALFLLPHSEKGKEVLNDYLKKDTPLPLPSWKEEHRWVWLQNADKSTLEGGTSLSTYGLKNHDGGEVRIENSARHPRQVPRQQGKVYESRTECGGIRISVG